MSQPTEPVPGWQSPNLSQPDPAAYLRADHMPGSAAEPSVPLLYPSGPTEPPPPPFVAPPPQSAPVYFSMLYSKEPPARSRRGLGIAVGVVCGLILVTILGGAFTRGRFFTASSFHATVPSVPTTVVTSTTFPAPTPLPGGAGNPTPAPQGTPGTNPAATLTPVATPPVGATPTSAPAGTATAVPPMTVSVGCLSAQDHHNAQFCVQTVANANLAITVTYCDGPQDTNVAPSGTADESGAYATSWVPSHKPKGCSTATVRVTATAGTQSGSGTGTLDFG